MNKSNEIKGMSDKSVAIGGVKKLLPLTILIIIAIVFYIFLNSGTSGKEKKSAKNEVVNVVTAEVTQQDVANEISLVGTVYPFETVAVKSRIDSQITAVKFKDGDNVTQGQVLFELDDSILKAQLNQYNANLNRDEAQLENARTQYERYRKLAKSGYASSEKLQESAAAFKTQEAAVKATKASIESLAAQLAFSKITAPISGRAGTINVTRGNNVKANDANALVTINRVKPILVQVAIPQRYYEYLKDSGKGALDVAAQNTNSNTICKGKLEYIDNMVDSSTGTFKARAVFENEDEKLWPGMFVNINITLGVDKNAIVIPQVALQTGQDGNFVFVVDKQAKKSIKRAVEVIRNNGNNTIIKTGLKVGELVVVDGLLKLSDGNDIEFKQNNQDAVKKPEEK